MFDLQQTVEVELLSVQAVTIHNSPYYDIQYRVMGADAAGAGPSQTPSVLRINPEAFYPNPQVGDRVAVNFLMGNIMGASKIS